MSAIAFILVLFPPPEARVSLRDIAFLPTEQECRCRLKVLGWRCARLCLDADDQSRPIHVR